MKFSRLAAAVVTAVLWVAPVAYAQTDSGAGTGSSVIQATVTGYATGGGIGAMTASGTACHWGTVAADWRVYPPGTRLQIEGFPNDTFTVEDTGGGVHGNIFDVWFPDPPSAAAFGTKSLKVTVLP